MLVLLCVAGKRLVVFLDYDGTLTPIVSRPDAAVMSAPMRQTLRELAEHCIVAIVTGRSMSKIVDFVNLDELCTSPVSRTVPRREAVCRLT